MIYLAHFNFLQTTGIDNNKSQTGSVMTYGVYVLNIKLPLMKSKQESIWLYK